MPNLSAVPVWVVLAVVALVVVTMLSGLYNGLVVARNRFRNAFAQIDVQLKRRYDLIPNLVEIVKGYMTHERETLESVIRARNEAVSAGQKAAADPGDPNAMKQLSGAESQLSGALGRLFALSEAYPDLKANQNMLSLQEELTSTENKVSFSRQAYNDSVMQYNNMRESFPTVIVASLFGFLTADQFEITDTAERQAPKVSFS
ncbi:LemA family protein [bacterium]|nr:LemA family protein [bacterium]